MPGCSGLRGERSSPWGMDGLGVASGERGGEAQPYL